MHITRRMRVLPLSVLIASGVGLAAQEASPYVPLGHWAVPYVEQLIASGVLRDPTPLTRPLKQADLVRALEAVDTLRMTDAVYATVQRLLRAFRPEVPGGGPRYRIAGDAGLAAATYNVRDPLELGRGVPARPYGPNRVFGNVGAELQLQFGSGIAVTHVYEDTRLRTDPDWFDTRRNGLRAAEAYVGGQWRYADVSFGVLDRNWGPSGIQGLLLSDDPYNMDNFALRLGPPSVNLQAMVTQLDALTDSTGATVNRFMMQHRLYMHPPGRWTVALWEGTVWSGVGRQAEPWYLNVVNVGYLVGSYNGTRNSNGFLGLDLERQGATTLFGQFLLDDIQVQRRDSTDLKPTSYGLTVGAKGGLRQGSVAWTGFYTRVANLTYRNEDPTQKPLFHLLGTGRNFSDYDQATIKLSVLTPPGALLEPELTLLRQGEGDPRLPHPPVSAYPTTPTIFEGVVERTIRIALGGTLQQTNWGIVGNAGVHLVHNAGHVTGASATHFVGSLGVTFRFHTEHSVP